MILKDIFKKYHTTMSMGPVKYFVVCMITRYVENINLNSYQSDLIYYLNMLKACIFTDWLNILCHFFKLYLYGQNQ